MKKLFFLTVLVFLFLFSAGAKAKKTYSGNKDLRLSEIDKLIRKTEYEQALELLNVYIELNPENFDNAQIRIKRILNARTEYAKLAEKLIHIITTDPENNKVIYEITAQLEKFERHPSDEKLQFIADVKKSAEFNYFRAVFLDIQNEAAELTEKKEYIAAVEKIKEGFWLYKDNFYTRWEDDDKIIKNAETTLANLDNILNLYETKDYFTKLNDSVNKFIASVNADLYKDAVSNFNNVRKYFAQLKHIYKVLEEYENEFSEQFQVIQELDSDTTDASFLPFMIRYITGIDTIENSGLTGILEYQQKEIALRMSDAVLAMLSNHCQKYCELQEKDPLLLKNLSNYISLNTNVLTLYKFEDKRIINLFLKNLVAATEKLKDLDTKLQQIKSQQNDYLAQFDNTSADKSMLILSLFSLINDLTELIGSEEDKKLENMLWTQKYLNGGYDNWNNLIALYSQILNHIFEDSRNIDLNSWKQIAAYYTELSDNNVAVLQKSNEASNHYISGYYVKIPQETLNLVLKNVLKAVELENSYETDPDLDFGIKYSYPDVANNIANNCLYQSDIYKNTLSTVQENLSKLYENNLNWKNNEEITAIINELILTLQTKQESMLALKQEAEDLAQLSQNRLIAFQLAKNEADIRFEEAEAALRKKDFATARKKLQDSISKYDEALNNKNDEKLLTQCDKKLQELGEKITRGENEYVVVEVRNLKNLAKDAYFNGRFEDAEKYLNQAKIRWADTNVTEDDEITNLMTFVSTAVSMKTGREIQPSSPQYPEMSQLLNIAYQHYNSGSEKYKSGQVEYAEEDLKKATESIQKLQYVYPLNQEASLLTLKINRLQNPEKFNDELAQKIEAAKFMCKNKDTQQEGYANLLDYYQLEPEYKGLKNLIYQVEIEIGIRQKPADNSSKQKAKNLYTEAKKMFAAAGTDRVKLENALEKINESLAINSDDKDSMALKDQITTKIGGNTSTVLSTEDERLYQLAIQRLQNNNIPGANAIVDQLLKKPGNIYSKKIKDLKVKIEARS